tara:strand:- start:650 stop:1192 length:543 start_codon:yes stop_codon:yes gene_type:complete
MTETSAKELAPQQYEVLKLKTGQEIVGMTKHLENGIEITLPMICQLTVMAQKPSKDTLATFFPYAPLSQDATILIPNDMVAHQNTMNKQFIPFYDKASSEWMQMIESGEVPLINNLNPNREDFRRYMDGVVQQMINSVRDNPLTEEELEEFEQEMLDEEFREKYDEFALLPAPIDKKKLH